jgi:hypothetical protein
MELAKEYDLPSVTRDGPHRVQPIFDDEKLSCTQWRELATDDESHRCPG